MLGNGDPRNNDFHIFVFILIRAERDMQKDLVDESKITCIKSVPGSKSKGIVNWC